MFICAAFDIIIKSANQMIRTCLHFVSFLRRKYSMWYEILKYFMSAIDCQRSYDFHENSWKIIKVRKLKTITSAYSNHYF